MEITRREFLKESLATLGFLALPGGLFAVPAGWKPKKKAKLEVSLDRIDKIDRIDNRGKAANGKNPVNPVNPVKKGPGLRVKIPLADGNPGSRVYAYDVVVVGDDPKTRFFKSVYFEGCNVAPEHAPNNGITEVEIPAAELPAGKELTVAVRPVSSLGTKGKTIGATWRT